MATGARVVGLRETVRKLERYGVSTQDLKKAFGRISANTANTAESRVPRRTGATAGTIRASKTKNKAVVRAGGARAPGTGPVHYGWPARNIPAQPWLSSAADDNTDQSLRLIEQELNDLARRYNIK